MQGAQVPIRAVQRTRRACGEAHALGICHYHRGQRSREGAHGHGLGARKLGTRWSRCWLAVLINNFCMFKYNNNVQPVLMFGKPLGKMHLANHDAVLGTWTTPTKFADLVLHNLVLCICFVFTVSVAPCARQRAEIAQLLCVSF